MQRKDKYTINIKPEHTQRRAFSQWKGCEMSRGHVALWEAWDTGERSVPHSLSSGSKTISCHLCLRTTGVELREANLLIVSRCSATLAYTEDRIG